MSSPRPTPCRLVAPRPPLTVPEGFHAIPARPGLHGEEREAPYARFFDPTVAPLRETVAAALAHGGADPADFMPAEHYAEAMSRPGYLPVENGWTLFPDGVMGVAVHTPMPGVRAAMWDWWFAWHSEESARYKLWHPAAHLVAQWAGPPAGPVRSDRDGYVGRTSLVKEILDRERDIAIRFIDPAAIGMPHGAFDGTTIHARGSATGGRLEEGGLMHQVRNTADGCEMRSRFYFNLNPGCLDLPDMPPPDVAIRQRGPMMVRHCAEEMAHLAGFLAALHSAFGTR